MGRKKKKVEKPWCWYCNREFEDDKILIQHQKAKHFKCHICHKKLFSGPGLAIHCMQVHKETVTKVPSAIPGRDSTEYEIYGMEGVPEGATRGRAMDDDEPSAKHPRMDNIAMPPMPPPPGMAHFPPFPPMPGMPPMPPFGMPPFPGGPMPPFPPGPGGMPPMPPTHGMYPPGPYPPRGVPPPRIGYGAGPPTGPMPPVAPPREAYVPPSSIELPPDDGDHGGEDRRWGYNGRGDEGERESSYDRDYDRRDRERYDSPRDGGDVLPSSAKAGPPPAVKLGAKTRIMHPDDHSISLEERRAMMVMSGAAPSYR